MPIKEELNNCWKLIELKKFASEIGINGRSQMCKKQLVEAIALHFERI